MPPILFTPSPHRPPPGTPDLAPNFRRELTTGEKLPVPLPLLLESPIQYDFFGSDFLAFSHGTLIFLKHLGGRSYNDYQPILVDPLTQAEVVLTAPHFRPNPNLYCLPYYYAVLTAPPSHPDSILLLFSVTGNFLALRLGHSDACWSIHRLNNPPVTVARTFVSFNGRLLSISKAADKLLDFTDFDPDSAMPSSSIRVLDVAAGGFRKGMAFGPCDRHLGPQLVECGGELMLLFYSGEDPECDVRTRSIDLYRMDFERMQWVATDSIGDHALFVDCKGWAAATACPRPQRWGGERDVVYVVGSYSWNVFSLKTDFDSHNICSMVCGSAGFDPFQFPRLRLWIYPTLRFGIKPKQNQEKENRN